VQEKTSSSLSGRHVGHYKAAAKDDILSQIHAMMTSLPYMMGFSPYRRRNIVDAMLEKEPGNPKLHRLRIIALIESDYNQFQCILIACRLTHHLEDNNIIPDMQYGSRPGKLCISPVLNKQLSHDIIHQTKQTAAIIKNDAVGCYDRIMSPLLLLAMRRLAVTTTATQSLGLTWSHTTHAIKTQYGVSTVTYSNEPTNPCYDEEDEDVPVPSLCFQSVDCLDTLENNGESFVDDSNLGSSSSLPIEPDHVAPVDQDLQSASAILNCNSLLNVGNVPYFPLAVQ
jgi:hypothetical protein